MICQRCSGLIVQAHDHCWTHFRCTSCGDCFDTTVLNNRWLYKELKLLELETGLRVPTA